MSTPFRVGFAPSWDPTRPLFVWVVTTPPVIVVVGQRDVEVTLRVVTGQK